MRRSFVGSEKSLPTMTPEARRRDCTFTPPFSHADDHHTPPALVKIGRMRQAGSVDLLWLVLALGVCAALWYAAYRIEPHHVSKNGRRFLSTGQWMSKHGDPEGRRREVWTTVLPDGQLQVDVKRRMHHDVSHWSIEGKAPEPPPRRAVYVLRGLNADGSTQRMTIQLPSKSRAVAVLDEVLAKPRY